jgi:hypothetical protein
MTLWEGGCVTFKLVSTGMMRVQERERETAEDELRARRNVQ